MITLFKKLAIGEEKDYFMENLSMLLASGMGMSAAMKTIGMETNSKTLKKIISKIQDDIESGDSLWKSLQKTALFTDEVISLVRLGESSGQLTENLEVITLQQQKEKNFRSKIHSAMMYPAFVMLLTFIIGIGIAWFILPKLTTVFGQLKIKLPLITKILIFIGEFLKNYGNIVVPAMLVFLILLMYFLFFFRKTKFIGQWLMLGVPGVKKLMKEVEISRFSYILATLFEAGLPILDSLEALKNNTELHAYRKFYAHIFTSVSEGNSFQKSFESYKHAERYLPIAIQQMIFAGEKSGNLPETLKRISANYEGRIEITTKNLTVILEPILLIIVWLGVVAVALAIILPIYSLVGGFNPNP